MGKTKNQRAQVKPAPQRAGRGRRGANAAVDDAEQTAPGASATEEPTPEPVGEDEQPVDAAALGQAAADVGLDDQAPVDGATEGLGLEDSGDQGSADSSDE